MNKQHPDDHQLQRYLNKSCSELECKRMHHHLRSCPDCKSRLYAFAELESVLEQLPILEAPADMEARVMRAIQGSRKPPAAIVQRSNNGRFRSELVHCFIATAATFLFISSGLWTKLMLIDPVQWGADVQSKVSVIEMVVQRLSSQLLS